jgi:myosin heavy subunit
MDKYVWIKDEVEVFAKAKVIKDFSASKSVNKGVRSRSASGPINPDAFGIVCKINAEPGSEHEAHKDDVFKFNETHETAAPDLANINNLNEPAVLNVIRLRFNSNSIYTKIQPLIISMNPYKRIPHLYDIDRYRTLPKSQKEAHVYNIAITALEGLATDGQNQAVAVSGESGAGKVVKR